MPLPGLYDSLRIRPYQPDYGGEDRRTRHPRFRALIDQGPDAIEGELRDFLSKAPAEEVRENPRAWWQTALEWLDLPRNAAANLVYHKLFGVQPSSKEEFLGLRKIYGSDVLRAAGWKPDTTVGKVGQFLAGLTIDFATDPLSWLTGLFGVGRATATSGSRLLGSGGRAARTADDIAREAAQAAQRGQGLTVQTAAGVRHVRPAALPKLVEGARSEQALDAARSFAFEADAPANSVVSRGAAQLDAPDLFRGRWGVGGGTTPLRTTPLGHVVAGPAIIAGAAGGAAARIGGELGERALRALRTPAPIAAAVTAPLRHGGRALEAAAGAVGRFSDKLGTPFKFLPQADVFKPFVEIPGVAPAIERVEALLGRAGRTELGQAAAKVGGAVAEAGQAAARALGLTKTQLQQLADQYREAAERGVRRDEADWLRPLEKTIRTTAQSMGLDPDDLRRVLPTLVEYDGIIRNAAAAGDRTAAQRGVDELRAALAQDLPDYEPGKIVKAVDDLLGRTALGEGTKGLRDEGTKGAAGETPVAAGETPAGREALFDPAAIEAEERARGLPRTGVRQLRERLLKLHEELGLDYSVSDEGFTHGEGESLHQGFSDAYRAGYTFKSKSEAREVRNLLPKNLQRFVRVDPKARHADGADVMMQIGADEMAFSIIEHHKGGKAKTQAKLQELFSLADSDPQVLGPEGVYDVNRYRMILEGSREARAARPQLVDTAELEVGQSFKVGGDVHHVVEKTADTVTIADGITLDVPKGAEIQIDHGTLGRGQGGEPLPEVRDLQLPGLEYGRHSLDYKAGKNGDLKRARAWAQDALPTGKAFDLKEPLALAEDDTIIWVPIPSTSGADNFTPVALAERLKAELGGTVRGDLLTAATTRDRIAKGTLTKMANPRDYAVSGAAELPATAKVILVDDVMTSGGALRDARAALKRAGLNVWDAVVGRAEKGRQLTADAGQVERLAALDRAAIEKALGRPLEDLTRAEADEVAKFLGKKPLPAKYVELARELQQRRRPVQAVEPGAARAAAEQPGAADVPDPVTGLLPEDADQLAVWADEAVAAGKQGTAAILRHVAGQADRAGLKRIFGTAKPSAAEHRGRSETLVKLGMLRAGRGTGANWENIYARLKGVTQGRPGKHLSATFAYETIKPGGAVELNDLGRRALAAMEALLSANDRPELAARLAAEVAHGDRVLAAARRLGRPVPNNVRQRIALKRRVLDALSLKIDAAPEVQAAVSGQGLRLTPADLFVEPVRGIVETLVKKAAEIPTAERAKGIAVADLKTQRGLGYFPHYIGEGGSPLGKARRRWSAKLAGAWPADWKKDAAKLEREGRTTVSTYDNLLRVVRLENDTRRLHGLPTLTEPRPGDDLVQSISALLDAKGLQPQHASTLRREFLREATVRELNDLSGATGVAFETDPVRAFARRMRLSQFAQAGADFLREAIRQGLETGAVVAVKPHGPTPEGFQRLVDTRFGDLSAGYAVSDEIARLFQRMTGQMDNPGPLVRAWDKAHSLWKTAVLAAFPYTTTNLMSGVFQANLFDAYSAESWIGAKRWLEDMHHGRADARPVREYVKGLGAVGDMTGRELYELLSIEHGAFGRGLHGIEMEKAVTEGFRSDWSVVEAARSAFQEERTRLGKVAIAPVRAYFRAFRAMNVGVEDWMKTGFILERLRRGDDVASAAGKARFALNQSADLTDFEQQFMRRIIPFWGWMRGNAHLQMAMAVARPQLAALIPKMRGDLEAAFAGDETLPASLRPRHVADELGAQVSGGPRPEFANLTRFYPAKELGLTPLAGANLPAAAGEALLQGLSPFAKGPLEAVINRDLYWDRPIEEFKGQRKRFLGVNLPPGLKRAAQLIRPLNALEQTTWRGVPATAGEGAAGLAASAGARLFPIDVARQVYERERTLRDRMSAIMRDFARARDRADRGGRDWRADPETQRLAEIYGEHLAELERLPLKSLRAANRKQLTERREQRGELKRYAVQRRGA